MQGPSQMMPNMPLIQAPSTQSPVTPFTVNNTNIIRNLIPGESSYTCAQPASCTCSSVAMDPCLFNSMSTCKCYYLFNSMSICKCKC